MRISYTRNERKDKMRVEEAFFTITAECGQPENEIMGELEWSQEWITVEYGSLAALAFAAHGDPIPEPEKLRGIQTVSVVLYFHHAPALSIGEEITLKDTGTGELTVQAKAIVEELKVDSYCNPVPAYKVRLAVIGEPERLVIAGHWFTPKPPS
jgi:hypothetical protein